MSTDQTPDLTSIVASLEAAGITIIGTPPAPTETLEQRIEREGAEALAAARAVDAKLHTDTSCPHLVGEPDVPEHEPSALILSATKRQQDGEAVVEVHACLDCHEHCRIGCGLDRTVIVPDGTDADVLEAARTALATIKLAERHPTPAAEPSALEGRRL